MAEPTYDLTVEDKASQESIKLYFETYKHLTTLNTAAILILATFLERIFKTPKSKGLVAASLVCFLVSLVASLLMMDTMAKAQETFGALGKFHRFLEGVFRVVAYMVFYVGIVLLAAFTLINLSI